MDSDDLLRNSIYDYQDPFDITESNTLHLDDGHYRHADMSPSAVFEHKNNAIVKTSTSDPIGSTANTTTDIMSIYYDTIAFENTVGIVIPTIYSLIIFIGLVGNALVITVVLLNRHMRNSTNMLIVSLAMADLLFLVFCVPFTAADYALPIWVFSYGWCQVLQYLQYVTAYASVWTLVLMAFDRFLAVCLPVQSLTLRTVRNTMLVSGAVWVLILVLNVPLLQIYGIHRYYFIMEDRASCTFVAQANRTASEFQVQLHHLSFVTWGYLVPLSITCIFYFFMLRRLWWGMPSARLGGRASEESIRAKKKVTWMVSGVTITFAICWAPLNACFAISALSYRPYSSENNDHGWVATKTFVIIQFASQILAYANSCLNPILYAFLSENFRKGFYKICGFLFCCGETKLDFERTNEYGHGGTTIPTTGRLSMTPYSESARQSIPSAVRWLSPNSRRRRSQAARDAIGSLITEEEMIRRSSLDSPGGVSIGSRHRASASTPCGISMYRGYRDGCSATSNGEVVVMYKNANFDSGRHHQNGNGKNVAIIPKRFASHGQQKSGSHGQLRDACEQRLLDTEAEIGEVNL